MEEEGSGHPHVHVHPEPNVNGDDQPQRRIDGVTPPNDSSSAAAAEMQAGSAIDGNSVKGAATKFGGILDWKERRKLLQVQEEAADYHKRSQEAEAAKAQALQDLGSATTAIDDLRSSLDKASSEEALALARRDSELADHRLREAQQGVSESAAAKAELHGVRDSHAAALADLQSAKAELESLRKEHAATGARETATSPEHADKAVDELTAELVALKAELDASRAAHEEAEEKRMRLAMALEQDKVQWQSELERAQQDATKLEDEVMATKDLESKVAAASELLVSLRAELFTRAVEGTLGVGEEEKPAASTQDQHTLGKTKKELEDVKASVEKAKDEAKCLRVAAASLRADLEKEKAELAALRRREGVSSASIPSLEEELRQVTSDHTAAEARLAKESSASTPPQLSEARREAEQGKAKARSAQEEVGKAREEASMAKAAVHAVELRLEAVVREILAANTAEEIATASADALLPESRENKPGPGQQAIEMEGGVTLTAEEYEELSRRARETEEVAGKRVGEAVKLIKEAKDAEVRSLEKLAQVAKQAEQRRQALRAVNEEAEEAEFGKLSAERELRQWRAEHEQRRRVGGETASPRTGLAEISAFDDDDGGRANANPHILSPRGYMPRGGNGMSMMGSEEANRPGPGDRKATFFPRMVMFLARKRAQSWK